MNLSKVKTILIVLFICVDTVLLSMIIISTKKSTEIAPEIIQSTIKVLAQNDITVDSSIIPRKNTSAEFAQADNVISDYHEFALSFLGECHAENSEYFYRGANGTMSFRGDYFEYTSAVSGSGITLDEKSAVLSAQVFLEEHGFDLSSSKVSSEIITDGYSIVFRNYKKSMPVFNSVVTAEVKNNFVSRVYGSWFNDSDENGQPSRLKNVTGVLIDFISIYKDEISTPAEISALENGYTIFENDTYHKSAVLVPVWKITLTDESYYYCDARNSE